MPKDQTIFYATEGDLISVLASLEAEKPLRYTLTGLLQGKNPKTFLSYSDIPNLGHASHPTAVANPAFLLSLDGTEIVSREVPQLSGGSLFAFDKLHNSETIVLRPGGTFQDDIILYGSVGTVSQSIVSRQLYSFVGKRFRKIFKKLREFYVGREALEALNLGARLTIGASSPPEFDLKP